MDDSMIDIESEIYNDDHGEIEEDNKASISPQLLEQQHQQHQEEEEDFYHCNSDDMEEEEEKMEIMDEEEPQKQNDESLPQHHCSHNQSASTPSPPAQNHPHHHHHHQKQNHPHHRRFFEQKPRRSYIQNLPEVNATLEIETNHSVVNNVTEVIPIAALDDETTTTTTEDQSIELEEKENHNNNGSTNNSRCKNNNNNNNNDRPALMSITIYKSTTDSKLGIMFESVQGKLKILRINPKGLLVTSTTLPSPSPPPPTSSSSSSSSSKSSKVVVCPFQSGDFVLRINGIYCVRWSPIQAIQYLKQLQEGIVTILVSNPKPTKGNNSSLLQAVVVKSQPQDRLGIVFENTNKTATSTTTTNHDDGYLRIANLKETSQSLLGGPNGGSALTVGDYILSINGIPCSSCSSSSFEEENVRVEGGRGSESCSISRARSLIFNAPHNIVSILATQTKATLEVSIRDMNLRRLSSTNDLFLKEQQQLQEEEEEGVGRINDVPTPQSYQHSHHRHLNHHHHHHHPVEAETHLINGHATTTTSRTPTTTNHPFNNAGSNNNNANIDYALETDGTGGNDTAAAMGNMYNIIPSMISVMVIKPTSETKLGIQLTKHQYHHTNSKTITRGTACTSSSSSSSFSSRWAASSTGGGLNGNPTNPTTSTSSHIHSQQLYISKINPNGIIATCNIPLQVGYILLSINNLSCTKMSPTKAIRLLRETRGKLYLVAYNPRGNPNYVQSMAMKLDPKDKVGISFISQFPSIQNSYLKISWINPYGLFVNSVLNTGDYCILINGQSTRHITTLDAVTIVQKNTDSISIIARTNHLNGIVVSST